MNLFVNAERLDNNNKYHCSECNKKIIANKKTCFDDLLLPSSLIIHLKRFEWNYDTMKKSKLNDYYEFPLEFSIKDFCKIAISTPEFDFTFTDEYYTYSLGGVIVHTGNGDSGHYYSFAKDRKSNKFYSFNDTAVFEFDDNWKDECFGNKEPSPFKSNSAYILIYDRKLNKDLAFIEASNYSLAV